MAGEWKKVLDQLTYEGFIHEYFVDDKYLPVSVVGDRLTQDGNALSEIPAALAHEQIEVLGGVASPLALTFSVPAHRAQDAVKVLHERFQSNIESVREGSPT